MTCLRKSKSLTATVTCLVGFTVAMIQLHGWGQDSAANLSTTGQEQKTFPHPNSAANTNATVSFQLKPTAIAPAGAAGSAEVKGTVLMLHLSQLDSGKYDVQAVHSADGTIEKLGTITIADPTSSPSRQANDNKKEASANPESTQVVADASITLARQLAPRDITRVRIAGAGGNAVLDSGP